MYWPYLRVQSPRTHVRVRRRTLLCATPDERVLLPPFPPSAGLAVTRHPKQARQQPGVDEQGDGGSGELDQQREKEVIAAPQPVADRRRRLVPVDYVTLGPVRSALDLLLARLLVLELGPSSLADLSLVHVAALALALVLAVACAPRLEGQLLPRLAKAEETYL